LWEKLWGACICSQRRLALDQIQETVDARAIEDAVAKTLSEHGSGEDDDAIPEEPEEQGTAADAMERKKEEFNKALTERARGVGASQGEAVRGAARHGRNQQAMAALVAVMVALGSASLGGYTYYLDTQGSWRGE
jgi:hypothetical protein